MADEKPIGEVEKVALQLFAERSSRIVRLGATRQVALESFRDAQTFLQVQAEFRSGRLVTAAPLKDPRAECFAPNLKKTHPHNLVSQEFGDLSRVAKIYAELKADPTRETYEECDWDKPQVDLARILFPAFLTPDGKPLATTAN